MKLEDVFHDYDPMRKGHVSKDDFRKACKEIFQELLTEEQLDGIQSHYCSDDRPDQCNWSSFMHDAESGLYHARFSPCSSLNIFYYRYPSSKYENRHRLRNILNIGVYSREKPIVSGT